jgi:hypothetical protein
MSILSKLNPLSAGKKAKDKYQGWDENTSVKARVYGPNGKINYTRARMKKEKIDEDDENEGFETEKIVYELKEPNVTTKPVDRENYFINEEGETVVEILEVNREVYMPLQNIRDKVGEEGEDDVGVKALASNYTDFLQWAKNAKLKTKIMAKREKNNQFKQMLYGALVSVGLIVISGAVLYFVNKDVMSFWQNNQQLLQQCIQNGAQVAPTGQ